MKASEYRFLVLSDLYRVTGDARAGALVRQLLFGEGFRFLFWLRTCRFARSHWLFRYCIYPFALLMFRRYTYKFGISIPYNTEIGPGFYIGHFGGIVINQRCRIGRNCNISHGVTLGKVNRGLHNGYPIIGNNVMIGPGAVVLGGITIGDNAAIGANCVVTKDVPEFGVVVGVPGRVISSDGSAGYINLTDYEGKIVK